RAHRKVERLKQVSSHGARRRSGAVGRGCRRGGGERAPDQGGDGKYLCEVRGKPYRTGPGKRRGRWAEGRIRKAQPPHRAGQGSASHIGRGGVAAHQGRRTVTVIGAARIWDVEAARRLRTRVTERYLREP